MPERFRANPGHVGIAFQLDEGLRLPSIQSGRAGWLSPEQRTDIDNLTINVNTRLRLAADADRDAMAKRIQTEMDNMGYGNLMTVHPFPINYADTAEGGAGFLAMPGDFVSLPRPKMRMKGVNTNRTWGRVLQWLDSGLFDSDNVAVQRFLRIQPGESRSAYGLRMSSILPGIDTKTALMSMSSAGPSMLAHGAMDTHGVRYTAQSALKRGELGNYWQDLTGVEFLPTSDHTVFEAATKQNTRNWNLSPHEPEEFVNNKVFLNAEGDTGFMVTPEGDLQNVFSNSKVRGAGRAGVERAIAEGAVTLDAYDGFLPGYYAQHGFRETGRVRFVDEFAPEGYDIATQGRPDIVFMARTGATDNVPGTNYFDDWDEAKAHSRTMVPKQDPGAVPVRAGSTPVPPGKIRAYHYTRDIDSVEKTGLDVQYAKGETYGEPNALWFSTSKPNDDTTSYVEVFLDPSELDIGSVNPTRITKDEAGNVVSEWDQQTLDDMMEKGGNFTIYGDRVGPERFVTVSRPRNYRLTYMVENYPPGSAQADEWIKTDAEFVRGLDPDYQWAMDEFVRLHEAAAGTPQAGLLDRLTPSYAAKLRKALQSGGDEFPAPSSKRVYLVPSGMRKKPWSPAKLQAMRDNLHLIPDPEARALYDDDEVLRYVSETDGKVNIWEGGDYAVMEEYFSTTLRADEVRKLRDAGHNEAADAVEAMTGAEWQWFKWDHIRSGKGTPLDPHVGVTVGADTVQPRTGGELDRAIRVNRLGSPFDPHMGALFQQMDGKIMGAAQFDKDGRAMLLATQHADSRTGMHELAHVIEGTLDPSMRNKVMAQFREATGSTRQQWNRDVSEWWADEFLRYIRGGSLRGMDPTLRSSFEYFRKTIGGVEATIKAQAAERAATAGRASAIKRATKAIERTTTPARDAEKMANAAMRELESRNRELRRARGRAGIDTLESKARALQDEVTLADQNLRDAKAAVRAATQEVKQARVRAKEALGSRSAGGAATGVNRKIAAQRIAEARVGAADAALGKARKRSVEANRKLAGAKRRTPTGDYVKARDQAKAKADKLSAKAAVSKKAADDARAALDEARRMPTKPPKVRVERPVISDSMQQVFDDVLRPKVEPDTKWGPGSPIDASAHYDIQEEAAYQAAQLALSRAEENAFTLHYYKRGRSMVERSVNHPYLGLYPASYMWGKVLPELLRFLLVKPFGLDAPLGGLLLANNIYRQTLMQQQYNEDFRKDMLGNTDAFHMLSLLLPASPWEVPVNAPLWMRRISENGLTYEQKLKDLTAKYGDQPIPDEEMPPLMDMASHGRTVRDMLSYAFVPAVEQITGGAGTIFGAADTGLRDAAQGVEGILKAGNAPPPVPLEPEVVAPLPDRTTLPSAEQGYQP